MTRQIPCHRCYLRAIVRGALLSGLPADLVFRLKPVAGAAIRNVERVVGPCCAINLLTRPAQLG